MSKFELKLPRMGESVAEATLTAWLKEVGDTIELDEPIFEIATDKVDSEVPSEVEGVLTEKRFEVDDTIKVGQVVAVIETEAEEVDTDEGDKGNSDTSGAEETSSSQVVDKTVKKQDASSDNKIKPPKEAATRVDDAQDIAAAEVEQTVTKAIETASGPKRQIDVGPQNTSQTSDRFYSPLVKNIAQQEGISISQLDAISGTGKEGRVTKNDILEYVENGREGASQTESTPSANTQAASTDTASYETKSHASEQPASGADAAANSASSSSEKETVPPQQVHSASTQSSSNQNEVIEMTRMGKLIAKHMTNSVSTSAHVQSFVEVDVTAIVNWRNRTKKEFEKREGEKLTFTPIFMEAVAKALKKYPMMNISVDGDKVIKKKNINIGMAAALADGNLIVPVIKNADQLNLVGMAKTVNDLAARARDNRLVPDEVQDGTYTVTNVGTFGSVFGTPIINQPQVGILALGAIRKLPSVIETPEGDFIGIRSKMFLSHSYDHRVVNGALGSMFVKAVADYLEDWDPEREV